MSNDETTYAWVFISRTVTCQAHKPGCQAVPSEATQKAVPMGIMTEAEARDGNDHCTFAYCKCTKE